MPYQLTTLDERMSLLKKFLEDYGIDRQLTIKIIEDWTNLEEQVLAMNSNTLRALDNASRRRKIHQMKLLVTFLE